MARLFIVVGDSLSGGGTVVSGSPFTDIDGSAMARVGDRAICKAHGPGTIVSGDTTLIIDGNPAARHGDKVSCGCQLIAGRQSLAFVDDGMAASATVSRKPSQTARGAGPAHPRPETPSQTSSALSSRSSSPQCWVDDHVVEVSTNASGRYYVIYDENGDELSLDLQRKFSILVPLKSSGNVEVVVRIKAVAVNQDDIDDGEEGAERGVDEREQVTDEDVAIAKTRMESGIQQGWNEKFIMHVSDPACGIRAFPIRFKVQWVDTRQHYTMNVQANEVHENVVDMMVNVWKGTAIWTFSHEYAHCVGVADEYSYHPVHPWTLKYYRPDGTLDQEAIQIPVQKPDTDPSATIMSTHYNTTVKTRHAWQIAQEVEKFLTRHTGRNIECNVNYFSA